MDAFGYFSVYASSLIIEFSFLYIYMYFKYKLKIPVQNPSACYLIF